MDSVWPTAAFSLVYVVLVTLVGPWAMKHREAMEVKRAVVLYNFVQILISMYLVYGLSKHGWLAGYSYSKLLLLLLLLLLPIYYLAS